MGPKAKPKAPLAKNSQGRKRQAAASTDTPKKKVVKKEVEEKPKKKPKLEDKEKDKGKGKGEAEKKVTEIATQTEPESESEEESEQDSFDNDEECSVCREEFDHMDPDDDPVQCCVCDKWAHYGCSTLLNSKSEFMCQTCENDSDEDD